MLTYEDEPLPKNHPHWRLAAEAGFELSANRAADGYKSLTRDLAEMVPKLRDLIRNMSTHAHAVAKNPAPYRKVVDEKRDALFRTQGLIESIWNPKHINPLNIMGSLSNPTIWKHVEDLKADAEEMLENKGLKSAIERYKLAHSNVEHLLRTCDTYLDPNGPLISSTRGRFPDYDEEEDEDVPTQS